MNFTFDTRFIVLICCLMQGLAGLRLIKVSIPAFKLRGESAFLECQYELNSSHSGVQKHSRHNTNHQSNSDFGNEMNYFDTEPSGLERPVYRHMRTTQQHRPPYQGEAQRQYQPPLHQPAQYQQHQYQQQPTQRRHYYPQQEYDQQQQYQTQPSPYGHSVYRGSYSAGGQTGASTHNNRNGNGYMGGRSINSRDDDESQEEEVEEPEEEEQEGEALYAIKWYKDNEEFYRYVPKANPPKTSYRVDGVRVIEEHSDHARVLLRGLTLNSTGQYRCEVSAEAPNFSSVQGEGRMDIVFLPRDGPHIKGQQFQYQIGEVLNLNCTSGKSHPASHLQWFINDQPVMDGRFLIQYNDTVHKHGLITSTLGLRLTVDARHFHNGAMRVKCLASISPVLWKGGKESVLQRRPGIIDNREAMLLVRSSSNSLHQQKGLLSCLRLMTITAILTKLWQLFRHKEFT